MVCPLTQDLKFSVLAAAVLVICVAQVPTEECPHPDNNNDAAIIGDDGIIRPPSGISQFSVTGVGAYNIDITWDTPVFNFNGTIPIPCHFYLNVTYTSSQRGSHMRTTHMNLNYTMRSASVEKLTPDTLVTLRLSTCLLMPSSRDAERGFICTKPVKMTQKTSYSTDNCSLGFYNHTGTECSPCLCSNNTKLCESKTGKCLDCLYASDGDQCEGCVSGYTLTEDNKCELSRGHNNPQSNPEYAVHVKTTSLAAENRITTPQSHGVTDRPGVTTSPTEAGQLPNTTEWSSTSTPPVLKTSETRKVPLAIILISTLCCVAVICCLAILIYRKCGGCQKKPIQFWTVQLQPDSQPTIAYSDIIDSQISTREDNRLIENDFNGRLAEHQLVSDENPYRPITA